MRAPGSHTPQNPIPVGVLPCPLLLLSSRQKCPCCNTSLRLYHRGNSGKVSAVGSKLGIRVPVRSPDRTVRWAGHSRNCSSNPIEPQSMPWQALGSSLVFWSRGLRSRAPQNREYSPLWWVPGEREQAGLCQSITLMSPEAPIYIRHGPKPAFRATVLRSCQAPKVPSVMAIWL